MESLFGAARAEDLNLSAPEPVKVEAIPRSAALAWLLSVVMPGLGQMYCGRVKRGVVTLVASTLALLMMLSAGSNDTLFATSLFSMISAYAFATIDAYYTAREVSSGSDQFMVFANPRVAGVLNLVTNGFGYFYLGERTKGLLVFLGVRMVVTPLITAMGRASGPLGEFVATLFLFVLYGSLAVHAWKIAQRQKKEALPAGVAEFAATSFPAGIPILYAAGWGAAYLLIMALGTAYLVAGGN